jgi:hypothetical protein
VIIIDKKGREKVTFYNYLARIIERFYLLEEY